MQKKLGSEIESFIFRYTRGRASARSIARHFRQQRVEARHAGKTRTRRSLKELWQPEILDELPLQDQVLPAAIARKDIRGQIARGNATREAERDNILAGQQQIRDGRVRREVGA